MASYFKECRNKRFRIHDLRRSLGSWQAATGANLSIVGKTLAHKNVSTTASYACLLNIDPVRESMNKATQEIF
jgi:integrase